MKRVFVAGALSLALGLLACGDDGGETSSSSSPAPAPSPAPSPTPTPTPVSSLGADGWAGTAGGTTGGNGAATAKTYMVTNRNELLQALYGGTAVIADDGSFTGTLDASPKIINVSGIISLNANKALVEQTADAYVAGSCAATTNGYASEAALWTDYYAAYRPSVYGTTALPKGKPEDARACAAAAQKKVVMLPVPSNTSILGVGTTGKIIHGNLILGSSSAPVENIVIRNVTFEDSFDFFPQWDPTDSTTGRWNSAYDLVSVLYGTRVWIDHTTFSDGARIDKNYPSVWSETVNGVDYRGDDFKVQHHDGLVDVTKLASLVTISSSLFFNHDKSFLIGGTDTASRTAENPGVLKVTFHDNLFRDLRQRIPRVRFGQVHVYNNLYQAGAGASDYPLLVGWTVGQAGKIYAENNVFQYEGAALDRLYSVSVSASRVTACVALGFTTDDCTASFFDSGTELNGALVNVQAALLARYATVTATKWRPADAYAYTVKPTAGLADTIQANAGAGKL